MLKTLFLKLHHSLYAKIVIAIVGTVFLVGLHYTILINRMKQGWCEQWAQQQADSLAVILHNRLHHADKDIDAEEMTRFLHFLKVQTSGTELQVLNDKRAVMYRAEGRYGKGLTVEDPIRCVVPLEVSWCQDCRNTSKSEAAFVLYEIPQASVPLFTRTDERLLEFYTIFSVIVTTVVILSVIWLVIKRPLSRLMQSIQGIKHGNLNVYCPDLAKDEIGQLADNLNLLLKSVESKNQELEKLYQIHMEEASRLANIGEMASGLAHEIKTPLHGVIAAMQVINRRDPDMPHKTIINQMEYQLHRVVRILDDMLQFARPQKPMFDSCSIGNILDKVMALLQADIEKSGITVTRNDPKNLPLMRLDSEKMQQVFLNLILNAVQACSKGDSITVDATCSSNGDQVVVRVRDDGPGIPADAANQIFTPFFTTKEKGNGLGLPITKTIIEQHKGTIALVDRDQPGTCFEVRLPILKNVQFNLDTDSGEDDVDTSDNVLDAYLLSVLHDCDGTVEGICSSGLMCELAKLSVDERKEKLKTIGHKEKLLLRKAHLECAKCKE